MGRTSWLGLGFRERRWEVVRGLLLSREGFFRAGAGTLDEATLRQDIHPHTRRLFDTLEAIIAGDGATVAKRRHARRQAFAAWASALGLMTMIGLAEATHDPLVHSHESLLSTLARAFELPRT